MREDLRWYIDNGFRPIPVHGIENGHQCRLAELDCTQCIGKVPLDYQWADRDFFNIDDFPDGCNIALAMGKQPNGKWLLGMDVDGILNIENIFNLPYTLTNITGRGRHLIYEVYPDAPFGNWIDVIGTRSKENGYKNGFTGALDLRYCRGALIAPPSIHKSGTPYRWRHMESPAVMPHETIIDLIRMHKKNHPDLKTYPRWTADPSHKGKRP